jgi:excisionase family DNA binding protein
MANESAVQNSPLDLPQRYTIAEATRMLRLELPPLDLRQRYTINEACAYLRQSRTKTYKDIKDGKLEVIKDGKRTYVSGRAIAARSQ